MSAREYVNLVAEYARQFDRWSDSKYHLKDSSKFSRNVEDHLVSLIALGGVSAYTAITGKVIPEEIVFLSMAPIFDALKNRATDYIFEKWSVYNPNVFEKAENQPLDKW